MNRFILFFWTIQHTASNFVWGYTVSQQLLKIYAVFANLNHYFVNFQSHKQKYSHYFCSWSRAKTIMFTFGEGSIFEKYKVLEMDFFFIKVSSVFEIFFSDLKIRYQLHIFYIFFVWYLEFFWGYNDPSQLNLRLITA